MIDWSAYHHLVEQRIDAARREGAFDQVPRGRLAIQDAEYEPDWWLKRLLERESLASTARVPRAGSLHDRLALIMALATAEDVRRAVIELNADMERRFAHARTRPPRLDPEMLVERWRQASGVPDGAD